MIWTQDMHWYVIQTLKSYFYIALLVRKGGKERIQF